MKKITMVLGLVLICACLLSGCGKEEVPYNYDLSEYVSLGAFPKVEFDESKLTEKIDSSVESITSNYKTMEEMTDRPSQEGDTLNIDYVGKIGGEEFDGGSNTGEDLVLGSDRFIPGFEDGLVGKNKGDEVVLNLVFPEDFSKDEFAGKEVEFTVKINKISAEVVPMLTDEMVKEKTEYTTVSEFIDANKKSAAEEILLEAYLSSCRVLKYPEKETKIYYDYLVDYYNQYAVSNGMTLESFVKGNGYSDLDSFLKYAMTSAMSSVRDEMIITATIRDQKIEVSDEEYNTLGEEMAKEYQYESLKEYEKQIGKSQVMFNIQYDKLIDMLYEASGIEESYKYELKGEAVTEGADQTTETPAETTAETSAETTAA